MAIAPELQASGRGVNGSAFFVAGMNSSDDPMFIDDRGYVSAMNVVNRGGILQSRPGYRCLFELPEGRLQGLCYYRPFNSSPFLVFVVDGLVYTSKFPFTSYSQLQGLQFYEHAKRIYWATAIKSVRQEDDGSLTLIDPVRLVVMQDGGYTKAGFWDGAAARHLNPSEDETPLGGPMLWSGDRLWVARKNRIFASDISDPLKFTETTYLAEGGSFFMPEDVVTLAEIPGLKVPQMAAFTESKADIFQTGVRDRSTWKTLASPFQAPLFPSVGCVAPRSMIAQHGQLWWMSSSGITNFNAAQQSSVTSAHSPQDLEMAISKGNMSPNVDDICAGTFENFSLFSVPSGDKKNRHTWVADQSVLAGLGKDSLKTWSSVWTGTYPVEWATGRCNGVNRIFHISKDRDGANRLWESFTPDRLDNGLPITSYVETKTHIEFSQKATGLDLKRFLHAEITMSEIYGNVSVAVFWAGVRGRYKKIAEFDLVSTEGELSEDSTLTLGTDIVGYRPQTRKLTTPAFDPTTIDEEDSACEVESPLQDNVDVGFSLLVVWSGRAALRSYRIYADSYQENNTGACHTTEVGETNVVKNLLVL